MTARKGNLSTFIAHMAVGQTLAQSARAAGLSAKSAQRRMQEPHIRTAITEAQADLTRHALARLRDLRGQAMDRLSQVLADDDAGWTAHMRAAELVMRHAAAADNAWVIDQVASQAQDIAALAQKFDDSDD